MILATLALVAATSTVPASVPDVGGPQPFPVKPCPFVIEKPHPKPTPASVPDVGGPGSWL